MWMLKLEGMLPVIQSTPCSVQACEDTCIFCTQSLGTVVQGHCCICVVLHHSITAGACDIISKRIYFSFRVTFHLANTFWIHCCLSTSCHKDLSMPNHWIMSKPENKEMSSSQYEGSGWEVYSFIHLVGLAASLLLTVHWHFYQKHPNLSSIYL